MSNTAQKTPDGVAAEREVIHPIMHHVNFKTRQVDEMIAWYGEVIGMTSVHQYPGGAWITNDAANHRIALLTSPRLTEDKERRNHVGLHHTAFEYTTMDDLLGTIVRVKEQHGHVPHMILDHGMTLSAYFVDPDGNSVELQVDWFGDWAKSKDFMLNSPKFEADPIGTFCDRDQLIAAWREGATDAELHERAYGGEFKPAEQPDMRFDPV